MKYKKGDVVIHTKDNNTLYKITNHVYWNNRLYYQAIGNHGQTLIDGNLLCKKSELRKKKISEILKIIKK